MRVGWTRAGRQGWNKAGDVQAARRRRAWGLRPVAGPSAQAWGVPLKVGKPAPDFQATLFDGHKVSLADLKGKVVVVNLWATWCGPCKVEMPLLDGYYMLRKDVGLYVLAVAIDDSASDRDLRRFSEKINLPMARTMRGPYRQLDGVPTNYIIDRAGVIRYAKATALTLDDMNKLFVPLLLEKAPGEETSSPPATVDATKGAAGPATH